MTARITGLRYARSLKSFGAVFEAYDGIKGKSANKSQTQSKSGSHTKDS